MRPGGASWSAAPPFLTSPHEFPQFQRAPRIPASAHSCRHGLQTAAHPEYYYDQNCCTAPIRFGSISIMNCRNAAYLLRNACSHRLLRFWQKCSELAQAWPCMLSVVGNGRRRQAAVPIGQGWEPMMETGPTRMPASSNTSRRTASSAEMDPTMCEKRRSTDMPFQNYQGKLGFVIV